MYYYEILFGDAHATTQDWQNFLRSVGRQIKGLQRWRIIVELQNLTLHYYLISPIRLPLSLNQRIFLLKPVSSSNLRYSSYLQTKIQPRTPFLNKWGDNLVDFIHQLESKQRFCFLEFNLRSFAGKTFLRTRLAYSSQNSTNSQLYIARLLIPDIGNLLDIDYQNVADFGHSKIPKYLSIEKVMPLLAATSQDGIFEVQSFPYADESLFLSHTNYDVFKHSVVIGSSGAGKSKLLTLLIKKLCQPDSKIKPRIVVIDPHDALKFDLGITPPPQLIDFMTNGTSVDLFKNQISETNVSVELNLSLLQSIFSESWNGRLERVLRYSLYLLMVAEQFSFNSLRLLLTESNFRNQLINDNSFKLPSSVTQFFLTDYLELKTQAYSEAIAPIIAFIDEMQMVPIFNQTSSFSSLNQVVQDAQLSIFSLNRLRLGDKVTRVIAGLLSQQLFLLAQKRINPDPLVIIIDEVSVIENPILARALSELRKYGVTIILAGQYFHQISSNLREAILANVTNYYLFRLSQTDAELLVDQLSVRLARHTKREDQVSLLTGLKTRECLVRISRNGKLYPVFLARTCTNPDAPLAMPDDGGSSALELPLPAISKSPTTVNNFAFDLDIEAKDIMLENSTSRKILGGKRD